MKTKLMLISAISALTLLGCGNTNNDDGTKVSLNISGLENLGANYAYEGWLIVDGAPVSAGIFTVNDNGALSQKHFALNAEHIENATTYVLTIEPKPDNNPAPSDVHILAGDFEGDQAPLTTSHKAALNTDFTSSTGQYILATPTDNDDSNEASGIWWLNPASGAGLSLPVLPKGWKYEGWAVINDTPVSTGTFTSTVTADDAAPYSGRVPSPPFPGEDFLMNAPSGLTFPLNLSGSTAVISVEPDPDNSPAPFSMKPLVGAIPNEASAHTVFDMTNNATKTNPTGTVSR